MELEKLTKAHLCTYLMDLPYLAAAKQGIKELPEPIEATF